MEQDKILTYFKIEHWWVKNTGVYILSVKWYRRIESKISRCAWTSSTWFVSTGSCVKVVRRIIWIQLDLKKMNNKRIIEGAKLKVKILVFIAWLLSSWSWYLNFTVLRSYTPKTISVSLWSIWSKIYSEILRSQIGS